MSHEQNRIEDWRRLLDDEQQGRSMRSLCRAALDARILLGGTWDRAGLEEEAIEHIKAGRYGAAAAFLSMLCLVSENNGFCPSCGAILVKTRCPLCHDPTGV